MKKWIIFFILFSFLFFVFDKFFILSFLFSIEASPAKKTLLWDHFKKEAYFSTIIPKKTLNNTDFSIIVPYYFNHELQRKGLNYKLIIKEITQNIPIRLNYQHCYIDSEGSIVNIASTVHEDEEEFFLFSIFIGTQTDQIEAYRKYVQPFIFFLLNCEDTIGPSVVEIHYNDKKGLSYYDYRNIHYILGKGEKYKKIQNFNNILSDEEIVALIEKKQFNEIDLRFENRIILRLHSNNS